MSRGIPGHAINSAAIDVERKRKAEELKEKHQQPRATEQDLKEKAIQAKRGIELYQLNPYLTEEELSKEPFFTKIYYGIEKRKANIPEMDNNHKTR